MSWEVVTKKNVYGRRHDELLKRWSIVHSASVHHEIHLQDLLTEMWKDDFPLADVVCQFRSAAGIHVNAMSELIRLKLKADTAWECAASLHDSGQVSWSNIDAHHASSLYARYLIGLCGGFIMDINGSWFLLDVFPDFRGNSRKHKQAFKIETKDINSPVALIANGTSKIDQRHIWQIMQRMMRVLSQDALDQQLSLWVQNFKFKDFRALRNKIFYTGCFWPELGDIAEPMPPETTMIEAKLSADYYENVWINSEDRDRILLQIMKSVSERLSPVYLRKGTLQEALAE